MVMILFLEEGAWNCQRGLSPNVSLEYWVTLKAPESDQGVGSRTQLQSPMYISAEMIRMVRFEDQLNVKVTEMLMILLV
jgi:hypothetical protein